MKRDLTGKVAVVTGASSGIGRAIALALSRERCEVCIIGRDAGRLEETAAAARQFSRIKEFQADLNVDENIQPITLYLEKEFGRLDVLIHCAGLAQQRPFEDAQVNDLDLQYATNVRAPYLLTQRLLPLLTVACGQIVFINSSLALTAKRPEVGQYSATKHALKAIADSLREEVNAKGIRVLSLYLGRTATPMQEAICVQEGRPYCPERLLQPEDVAILVLQVLMLAPSAEVTDINIRPMQKP